MSGEGNDPEVDGPKRQEARVQEEGHGLLLSPRQAMIGERAGEGVVKQKPVSKQPCCLIPLQSTPPICIVDPTMLLKDLD